MVEQVVVDAENFSVKDALDLYIATSTEYREADGKYHPSSMWQCDRQVIYKVRGLSEEEIDAASARRFYIGHRLHEVLQQALDMSPLVQAFYPEFHVSIPSLNIEGHGDGLILFADGSWCVLEIKSIRRSGFRYGLREENLKQAKTYATAVRDHGVEALSYLNGTISAIPALGDKLKGILVVYMEKEDLEIRQHWIKWEDSFREEVATRVAHLDTYRADPGSLPPRLPKDKKGNKSWQCRYCPLMKRCWYEDPTEIRPETVMLNF